MFVRHRNTASSINIVWIPSYFCRLGDRLYVTSWKIQEDLSSHLYCCCLSSWWRDWVDLLSCLDISHQSYSHSDLSNLLAGHWADRESIIEMIRASLPFWDWDNARQCAEMRSTPPTLSSPVFSRLPRLGQVITTGGCYKYFLLYRESYALVKGISCLSRVSFLVKDIVGMHFSTSALEGRD